MKVTIQFYGFIEDMQEFAKQFCEQCDTPYLLIQSYHKWVLFDSFANFMRCDFPAYQANGFELYLATSYPDFISYERDPSLGRIPSFGSVNESYMQWRHPRLCEGSTLESVLFARTEDANDEAIFKKSISRFRRETIGGMWGLDVRSGLYQSYRWGRWTKRAINAEEYRQLFRDDEASPLLMFSSEEALKQYQKSS